jgi:peptide/nickel transport system ATP-binding protein
MTDTAIATERPSADSSPLVRIEGFSLDLARGREFSPVLSDVTMRIDRGEVVGLVGESGSGKSTLALSMMGLVPRRISRVRGGGITVGGVDIVGRSERELQEVRGKRIGMVFQEPMTALDPAYRVGDQIAEMIRRHRGISHAAARREAIENLQLAEVADAARRADAFPHELSGGLRQRVCIAMAIACRPEFLIADEPTTALDVTTQAQILDLLRRLRSEMGMTVVLISHDLAVIAEFCDRVVVLYGGQVLENAPVDDFFVAPRHPYSSALLQALPEHQPPLTELTTLPGSPPALGAELPGCRFAPRCAFAQAGRCDVHPIPLTTAADGRQDRCIRSEELHLPGVKDD